MSYTERPPEQRGGGQRPWALYPSPLRYPGGKRKLAPFVKLLFEINELVDGEYAEVYAGGAGIALELLYEEYVRRIHINDLDAGIHAFWLAARDRTDELCRRVQDTAVTMEEWRRQRATHRAADPDPLDLAFATLFLNRTNRSGIITGGPIGGYEQAGTWRVDARYRRADMIRRLDKVGRFGSRIEVYRLDGADFLRTIAPALPDSSLIYLDPPYFVKGQEELYANYYKPADHAAVAALVGGLGLPWMVSYDNAEEIRALYAGHQFVEYGIAYTAQGRYRGREIAFFAKSLWIPSVSDPARVTPRDADAIRKAPVVAGLRDPRRLDAPPATRRDDDPAQVVSRARATGS